MRRHVFVHQLLQVERSRAAQGADDDVRAHTTFEGHVAAGIVEILVAAVVDDGYADLLARSNDQILVVCPCRQSDRRN
jgi:hypothetical protein